MKNNKLYIIICLFRYWSIFFINLYALGYLFILPRFRFYRFVCICRITSFSFYKYPTTKLVPPVELNCTWTLRLIIKKEHNNKPLFMYRCPLAAHFAPLCLSVSLLLPWSPPLCSEACRASITNNDCSVMDYTQSPIRSSLSACLLEGSRVTGALAAGWRTAVGWSGNNTKGHRRLVVATVVVVLEVVLIAPTCPLSDPILIQRDGCSASRPTGIAREQSYIYASPSFNCLKQRFWWLSWCWPSSPFCSFSYPTSTGAVCLVILSLGSLITLPNDYAFNCYFLWTGSTTQQNGSRMLVARARNTQWTVWVSRHR